MLTNVTCEVKRLPVTPSKQPVWISHQINTRLWNCSCCELQLQLQLHPNMGESVWPSSSEVESVKKSTAALAGRDADFEQVRVVASPYRICPLGAHIDHQGGTVTAMAIDKGILLGFVPSGDNKVILQSSHFEGEVHFRIEDALCTNGQKSKNERDSWGRYAKGAAFALQRAGKKLHQGIIGFVEGSGSFDSSGISSSAAVGVAYLLALETVNDLNISQKENIELDRLIENEYLGLNNGILDQSAILLSQRNCLTVINCRGKEYNIIPYPHSIQGVLCEGLKRFKILLAFSGLKQDLSCSPGYNSRVAECKEAASILLRLLGKASTEPILCNVSEEEYMIYKEKLPENIARRAEHYFSENRRVLRGIAAWSTGDLEEFGKLMSQSGLSSIENYECGCEPLIHLYNILVKAPGVYGARFSGAGFRGCCVALVDDKLADVAASFVQEEYMKVQPQLSSQLKTRDAVLICETGDSAHVI